MKEINTYDGIFNWLNGSKDIDKNRPDLNKKQILHYITADFVATET